MSGYIIEIWNTLLEEEIFLCQRGDNSANIIQSWEINGIK